MKEIFECLDILLASLNPKEKIEQLFDNIDIVFYIHKKMKEFLTKCSVVDV